MYLTSELQVFYGSFISTNSMACQASTALHFFFYCDNNSHYSNNSITADCVYLPLVYEVSFTLHSYGNELELGSLKPYQITDIRDKIKNQLVKEK